jgi:hypothetical protein
MKNGHKIHMKFAIIMVRMKDVATLDAKVVNTTFTHEGHNYIYELLTCEQLSITCHSPTLSQLVFSQVVFVQILFPMQQALDITSTLLASACITSLMCFQIW